MYQKHLLQPTNWQPILRKAFVITCRSHSNVFARCPFHEGTCCPPMWSELDDACWCYDPEVSIRIILMDLELSPRSFQQGQPSPCQKQFVSAILKIREKTSKLTRSKKRGWYTKDKMKTKLGWSKLPGSKLRASLSTEQFGFQQNAFTVFIPCPAIRSYINDVVKFCERKGNESLIKSKAYMRVWYKICACMCIIMP